MSSFSDAPDETGDGEKRKRRQFRMEHGGNRDHHAGEPSADIAARDAGEETALEREIERGVRIVGNDANQHSRRENRREPERHAHALGEGALFAQKHALNRIAAYAKAGDRGGDADLDQQGDEVLFHVVRL
jgi:hypothetical protein